MNQTQLVISQQIRQHVANEDYVPEENEIEPGSESENEILADDNNESGDSDEIEIDEGNSTPRKSKKRKNTVSNFLIPHPSLFQPEADFVVSSGEKSKINSIGLPNVLPNVLPNGLPNYAPTAPALVSKQK